MSDHPHASTSGLSPARTPVPGLLAAVLLGIMGPAGIAGASAFRPFAGAHLGVSAGHDNNILGQVSSATAGPDTTVSSAFGELRPVLDAGLRNGRVDFGATYALTWNGFAEEAAGSYQDHLLLLSARWQPSAEIEVAMNGREEWFRRTRFDDYDLDHRGGGAQLRVRPHPRLGLRGAIDVSRDAYPNSRQLVGSPQSLKFVTQVDEPTRVEGEATIRMLSRLHVGVGGSGVSTTSTVPRFEYDGRQFFVSATLFPGAGFLVDLDWAREWRDYESYPVVPAGVDPLACARGRVDCGYREDDSDSYSLEIRRSLGSRVQLQGSWSRIDYRSTVEGFSFDQTRFRAGLEILLARGGAQPSPGPLPVSVGPLGMSAGLSEMAPRISETGVRFRCRAPGVTQVTLVGSFNNWNRTATPMQDTDGDGIWEITLPLAAGTHRFMFLVDGTDWRRPEDAVMYEDDGFGLTNGIVIVP